MSFNAEDLKAKLQGVAKETTAPAEGAADGAAAPRPPWTFRPRSPRRI